jgi:hypothetical protein
MRRGPTLTSKELPIEFLTTYKSKELPIKIFVK